MKKVCLVDRLLHLFLACFMVAVSPGYAVTRGVTLSNFPKARSANPPAAVAMRASRRPRSRKPDRPPALILRRVRGDFDIPEGDRMVSLIIGSTAAAHWYRDWREPKDFDVMASAEDAVPPSPEGMWGDVFVHPRIADLRPLPAGVYATPSELYTLKHSHAYWELRNGSWSKHMADLLTLKRRGAKLIESWHDVLYEIWEDIHGRKVVDLTKEADEFFADAVKRVYDHDSIHRSVAYEPGRPIYEGLLKEGKSVQMDMARAWRLPFDDQVKLFREEIYATALERIVIPRDYRTSPGAAYQWALRRTITSLTRGRSAKFIVENFDIFCRHDIDYVAWHLEHSDQLVRL